MSRSLRSALLLFALALAAAAELAAAGGPMTYYSFTVRTRAATVTVLVNGIPVEVFTPDQFGSGSMNAWMRNGANEVVFVLEPAGDDPAAQASVETSGPDGEQSIASLEWPGDEFPATVTVEAQGLPEWVWLRAEPAPDAEDEVRAALGSLHAALAAGDEDAYLAFASGVNAAWEAVAGKEQVEASHRRFWSDFTSARLLPLAEDLRVESFRDGQVYRVTTADGAQPVQAEGDDGSVFSMGRWWGKVDGRWVLLQ